MPEETTSKEDKSTQSQQHTESEPTVDSKQRVIFDAEQQKKVGSIVTRELEDFQKTEDYKDLLKSRIEYNKLKEKQKEKDDAEKTELELANTRIAELEPVETEWKAHKEKVEAQLKEKEELIPDDKRDFYERMSSGKTPGEKLDLLRDFYEMFYGEKETPASPTGTKPLIGKDDKLMEEATSLRELMYPNLLDPIRQNEVLWKQKLESIHLGLKAKEK